jgi:hypothetical protein
MNILSCTSSCTSRSPSESWPLTNGRTTTGRYAPAAITTQQPTIGPCIAIHIVYTFTLRILTFEPILGSAPVCQRDAPLKGYGPSSREFESRRPHKLQCAHVYDSPSPSNGGYRMIAFSYTSSGTSRSPGEFWPPIAARTTTGRYVPAAIATQHSTTGPCIAIYIIVYTFTLRIPTSEPGCQRDAPKKHTALARSTGVNNMIAEGLMQLMLPDASLLRGLMLLCLPFILLCCWWIPLSYL